MLEAKINLLEVNRMIKIKNYTEPEELPDPNQNLLLPKHPFRLLIVGPSGCGKTNLVINLLNGFENPKNLRLDFDALYLCAKDIYEPKYSKLQETYTMFEDVERDDIVKCKKLSKNEKKELLEWFDKYKKEVLFSSDLSEFMTVDDLDPLVKNLVIFDDCVTEKDQKIIEDYFIRGRKKNASIIYLTQSYYSTPINIRKNCNYFIFFNLQPKEIQQIIREIDGNLPKKEFEEKYKSCDNFFMLDLVNPKLRYRNNFEPI